MQCMSGFIDLAAVSAWKYVMNSIVCTACRQSAHSIFGSQCSRKWRSLQSFRNTLNGLQVSMQRKYIANHSEVSSVYLWHLKGSILCLNFRGHCLLSAGYLGIWVGIWGFLWISRINNLIILNNYCSRFTAVSILFKHHSRICNGLGDIEVQSLVNLVHN